MNKLILHGTFLLVVLSGLSRIISLPVLGNKLQPFEILFVGVFGLFVIQQASIWKKGGNRSNIFFINPVDKSLLVFFFLLLINFLVHPQLKVLLEVIASVYMMAVYFLFSRIVFITGNPGQFIKAFKLAILLTAAGCIFGIIAYYVFGIKNFVVEYANSPYLGSIVRISGLSSSSNLLASFAGFGYLFCHMFLKGVKKWMLLVVVILISIAAQSKESFYFIAILFLYYLLRWVYKQKGYRIALTTGTVLYLLLFTFSLVATFWVLCMDDCSNPSFSLGPATEISKGIFIRPTGYYYLYSAAANAIQQSALEGIGLGNFYDYTIQMQYEGNYPANILPYEAHDLYWGMVAQLGTGYIVFAFVFIIVVLYCLNALYRSNFFYRQWAVGLLFCFLFLGLDVLGDVGALHFRHYWIVLGILSGIYSANKRDQDLKDVMLVK